VQKPHLQQKLLSRLLQLVDLEQDSIVIIGLGNPGADYSQTRHNAGFLVMDQLAVLLGFSFHKPWFSHYEYGAWHEAGLQKRLVFVKPLTFMNRSGDIVPQLQKKLFSGTPQSVQYLVLVDQMDLPHGELRLKKKGGTAGHNGLKSIHGYLQDAFFPLYIGIGRPPEAVPVIEHVLGVMSETELKLIQDVASRIRDGLLVLAGQGIDAAMAFVNSRPAKLPVAPE